jgi:Phospholipase_D-nuclease N-terminal
MLVAADYPFLDVFWTITIFCVWVIWVSVVVMVVLDNFRRRDHSGLSKALWTLFIIFVPLIGVLTYMIVRPSSADTAMA